MLDVVQIQLPQSHDNIKIQVYFLLALNFHKINDQTSILIIKEFDPQTQEGLNHCRSVVET